MGAFLVRVPKSVDEYVVVRIAPEVATKAELIRAYDEALHFPYSGNNLDSKKIRC
jgi:hypothetical protein